MISSAGKSIDNPAIFARNSQKNNNDLQNNGIELRENAFQRHSSGSGQNLYGSVAPTNNYHSINNSGIQQVKRISNCSGQDTPQQKVIRKQFSKSKDRNSSLNSSSNNNTQAMPNNSNNMSNNMSSVCQNNQSNQNNPNNVSALVNLQINTLGCSTVNDSSSIYTPSYNNAPGYSTNPLSNHGNNSANKQGPTTLNGNSILHGSAIKQRDSYVLKDATNMLGNQTHTSNAPIPTSNSKSVNQNQYSSVPHQIVKKEYPNFEYTLQPHRQSLLFKNSENIDPKMQSHLVSAQSERRKSTDRTHQQFYNIENKLPTQSDNLSTTKELDQEGQQHLRNVDNYQISTKCLNDLNSNSINNRSRPFSLFTKKQDDYDISQNCDQSIIPQETSNSNGVSQTFQNNQRYKQSLPNTSSHQLLLNNENNYQTQFKDLLDWKIGGSSKADLNNSHDQINNCENTSTDLSNKPTTNNLISDKKFKSSCDCLKEIAELKIMISEMQKNQIIQAQINQKLQQDNECLWKTVRSLNHSQQNKDRGGSSCDITKDNLYNEKENIKSHDKSKYSKIVKNLVGKNKELKKQNNEMEAVLKDILLQNEISRQRIAVRDKLSTKNSRAHSRSGVSSNNETDFIFDNHIQNPHYDGNTSQNFHVYRPRSSSNSQFASGANSSKRGNENKQKSTPYQNILKKANNLHENIEVLKQDSLILNQVGINLNTQQSNDIQHHQYTPVNENYGSINNDEQDNSNDTKIRQILSKIHQHNTLQNS